MIYRSKAPLRIGMAGGGTDISPYSDIYSGAILNATISLYAYAFIEPLPTPEICLVANDRREEIRYPLAEELPLNGQLDLLKAVYNCMVRVHGPLCQGFRLSTFVDAPAGSGLGTSSTLTVAIIGAFNHLLRLSLGEYETAHFAYDIERKYLGWAGGKQDQYAATFGGVNFMEFYEGDKVVVNPLRIEKEYLLELENNLLLYFSSTSRQSAAIIEEQVNNVVDNVTDSVEAMHQLKQQALLLKDALLNGRLNEFGEILDFGFHQKRRMAKGICTPLLDELYDTAKKAGALGGKISGAGGGGFMVFYCPGTTKYAVLESLQKFGGYHQPFQFVEHGLTTWRI